MLVPNLSLDDHSKPFYLLHLRTELLEKEVREHESPPWHLYLKHKSIRY